MTGVKGNTAQKRLVPISENLKAWLMTCRKDAGLVCNIARTPDAIRRLATRAGVPWKHNALRHSFISYRCAETQDIAKTSFEAGISALCALPPAQQIDSLHGYNEMSSNVMSWLSSIAESGRTVTADDVRAFFAGLDGERRVRRRYGDE